MPATLPYLQQQAMDKLAATVQFVLAVLEPFEMPVKWFDV